MSGYGEKPFGLKEVVVYNEAGASPVTFPRSMMFHFTPLYNVNVFEVEGLRVGANSVLAGFEWEMEGGGISLEAYSKLTGDTTSLTGSTPNRVLTMSQDAGDSMPYLRIYGRALSDEGGQARVRIYRAKLTAIEGTFRIREFWVTYAKGVAVKGSNPLFDVTQQETSAVL